MLYDKASVEEIINLGLQQLKKGQNADDSLLKPFFNLIHTISDTYWNKNIKKDIKETTYSKEDLFHDYIVYLSTINTSFIKTKNHLYREITKYYGNKFYTETKKAWQTISNVLNALSKEGLCIKKTNIKYNNSNSTVWCKVGRDGNRLMHQNIELSDTFSKCSIGNFTDKVAKKLLKEIFEMSDGPISMGDITDIIFKNINFTSFKNIDEEFIQEDGSVQICHEIEDKSIEPIYNQSFDIRVTEEAESRFCVIWENVTKLNGGVDVIIEGTKVLCCYFLPKDIYKKTIRLDSLGASSTVHDVYVKVKEIFRNVFTDLDFDTCVKNDVLKNILNKLNNKCSEMYNSCIL